MSHHSGSARPLLSVEGLSSGYRRGTEVVTDCSFHIDRGEIRAIIGPNGAGKSTLLKGIMGLLPRTHAERLDGPGGESLLGMGTPRIARTGISYVPEGRGLLSSLSVSDNLELGTHVRRARKHGRLKKSERDDIFELFPILHRRLGQKAGLLSGGEQQMLAIARALLGAPQLLLLDEPALGLAPQVRHSVAVLLRELVDRAGLGILVVEQDVRFAQSAATRGHILNGGRLGPSADMDALSEDGALRSAFLGVVEAHD